MVSTPKKVAEQTKGERKRIEEIDARLETVDSILSMRRPGLCQSTSLARYELANVNIEVHTKKRDKDESRRWEGVA